MKLLNKIQQELNAPKDLKNTFGNYNYRNAESILKAAKELIGLDGILTLNEEVVLIGTRYYVKSTATLSSEGESCSVSAYAREQEVKKGMDEAQITGAAISYARKYALGGLFALDDSKDDPDSKEPSKDPSDKLDDAQIINIQFLSKKLEQTPEDFTTAVSWASGERTGTMANLTKAEAARLIGAMTKKLAKGGGQ